MPEFVIHLKKDFQPFENGITEAQIQDFGILADDCIEKEFSLFYLAATEPRLKASVYNVVSSLLNFSVIAKWKGPLECDENGVKRQIKSSMASAFTAK